jgi:hypothetical protein
MKIIILVVFVLTLSVLIWAATAGSSSTPTGATPPFDPSRCHPEGNNTLACTGSCAPFGGQTCVTIVIDPSGTTRTSCVNGPFVTPGSGQFLEQVALSKDGVCACFKPFPGTGATLLDIGAAKPSLPLYSAGTSPARIDYLQTRAAVGWPGSLQYCFACEAEHSHDEWDVGWFWPAHGIPTTTHTGVWADGSFSFSRTANLSW